MSDLLKAAKNFQRSLTTRNVVARFVDRYGMEHPSEEARKTYLKDHPNADPSNHSVSKGDGGGSDGGEEKAPKGAEVHGLMDKLEKAHGHLDKGDVSALKSEIAEAEKAGDGKKLQKLKDEVEAWHTREDKYKAREDKGKSASLRGRRLRH